MDLPNIAVIAAISLIGLSPLGCSKTPAPSPRTQAVGTNSLATATNSVAPPSTTRELGVIQLTNHYETQIDLGKGWSCTIIPLLIDRRNLQLTLSLGSKNAAGTPTGLSVARVIAKRDQPFDITVNDMALSFTPKLVE
jgi:hypothetical protein